MNPILEAVQGALRRQMGEVTRAVDARDMAGVSLDYAIDDLERAQKELADVQRIYHIVEAACIPIPDRREADMRICPTMDNPLAQDRRVCR